MLIGLLALRVLWDTTVFTILLHKILVKHTATRCHCELCDYSIRIKDKQNQWQLKGNLILATTLDFHAHLWLYLIDDTETEAISVSPVDVTYMEEMVSTELRFQVAKHQTTSFQSLRYRNFSCKVGLMRYLHCRLQSSDRRVNIPKMIMLLIVICLTLTHSYYERKTLYLWKIVLGTLRILGESCRSLFEFPQGWIRCNCLTQGGEGHL